VARLDVCVVGEINPDLILYGPPKNLEPERETLIRGYRLTLGSSSAIFAHNLSALGSRVGMASKVGKDTLGQMALEWLSSGGVDVTHVRSSARDVSTGLTVILAHERERFILTYPGAIFDLRYEDIDLDYVFSARHLHVASYFLQRGLRPKVPALLCEAKRRGLTTSLDTNDDPDGIWGGDVRSVLDQVDILFPNEREARAIAQTESVESAIAWLSERVGIVAVKCGSQGASARKGRNEWRCLPIRVTAVDTVGAGDSFDAGFVHRFLEGASVEACLAHANLAGAYSTTCDGGIEAYRDRAGMKKFFREHAGA